MKRYIYVLLMVGCLFSGCVEESNEERKTTPASLTDEDEDNTKAMIDDEYIYKLPIIFHVLYRDQNDRTQYVPVARLQELVDYVNEIYRGNVYGKSEDIHVKFFLAQYDERGKRLKTPGVEYIKYGDEYPIVASRFMSDVSGKNMQYIWEPNEYINVMMYHFADEDNGLVLGVSHMPMIFKKDSTIAGLESVDLDYISKRNLRYPRCVSINSRYINQESTRYKQIDKGRSGYQYTNTDVIVTFAHELGHYLGLHHTFAEEKGENGYRLADHCSDTDYCEDTPSYNRTEYNDYLERYVRNTPEKDINIWDVIARNNCQNERFNSDNIMDYSVSFSFRLSKEQKHRIREVLYHSPLMPGPKKKSVGSRATTIRNEKLDLPMTIVQ